MLLPINCLIQRHHFRLNYVEISVWINNYILSITINVITFPFPCECQLKTTSEVLRRECYVTNHKRVAYILQMSIQMHLLKSTILHFASKAIEIGINYFSCSICQLVSPLHEEMVMVPCAISGLRWVSPNECNMPSPNCFRRSTLEYD